MWWLKQTGKRNSASLQPVLEVIGDSDKPFLYIARKDSGSYLPKEEVSDEKYLKDCFLSIGPFEQELILLEESVKLGNYQKKMDLVAEGFDKSRWVIEFKIVEEKREVGESKMPINIERMGMAIGQVLLYCASYMAKYPSQRWNIMPAVCTWSLGSGSSEVIELCKKLGVTMINLDEPEYVALHTKRQALRIYYLDDDNPRLFLSN